MSLIARQTCSRLASFAADLLPLPRWQDGAYVIPEGWPMAQRCVKCGGTDDVVARMEPVRAAPDGRPQASPVRAAAGRVARALHDVTHARRVEFCVCASCRFKQSALRWLWWFGLGSCVEVVGPVLLMTLTGDVSPSIEWPGMVLGGVLWIVISWMLGMMRPIVRAEAFDEGTVRLLDVDPAYHADAPRLVTAEAMTVDANARLAS